MIKLVIFDLLKLIRHKLLLYWSPSYKWSNPAIGKAFSDGFAEGIRRAEEPMTPEERWAELARIADNPMIQQSARVATFFYEETNEDEPI